jgi:hypothetical protein
MAELRELGLVHKLRVGPLGLSADSKTGPLNSLKILEAFL